MINKVYVTLFISLLALFAVNSTAQERPVAKKTPAQGFNYGFGIIVKEDIYQNIQRQVIPIPFVGYKSEKLSVFGPFVSYRVAESENSQLFLKLAPRFQGFEESDSDIFIGMAERESSFDAGMAMSHQWQNWQFSLSTMLDVLNRSQGRDITSKVAYRFNYGPIFFEPSYALQYLNNNHVDYYYGIRQQEVNEQRPFYQAKSTINQQITMAISTPILFSGYTRLALTYTAYGDEISDSPIVNKTSNLTFQLFFTQYF